VNYQRAATIRVQDIYQAMRGKGWLTLTQITAFVADKITPENGVRFATYYLGGAPRNGELPQYIARGMRQVVARRLTYAKRKEQVEHRKRNRESMFRLIETGGDDADQNDSIGQDPS
jgi:hypothetical protein